MLSDTKARKVKPGEKPIAVGGIPGLWFKAGAKAGTAKFYLRFVSPVTKKRRDMGLGRYPDVGIAQARSLAMRAREEIAQDLDPIAQRDIRIAEETTHSAVPNFELVAREVYEGIRPSFKNAKHSSQWINTLETYAFPRIGTKRVDQLRTSDFAELLRPIWLNKPETASRVKQRCERVMSWCIAHQWAETNPVSAAEALLPKQPGKADRVTHHPAVPWRNLPAAMAPLVSHGKATAGKDALLFLILTAARSGEVRGARWNEIDIESSIWTVPATRMKTKRQHRVPLSAQAINLLQRRQQFGTDLVFTHRGTAPLSDMTLTKLLRDKRISSDVEGRTATAHGFRSSFRDWASENGYSRDLAERALAHTIRNATEAAYHRTDQLDQRAPMMQAWANQIFGL